MKEKKFPIGWFAIGSTLIWGLVIFGCALAFKGTEHYQQIRHILGGGATLHLIFIWGPLGLKLSKKKMDN